MKRDDFIKKLKQFPKDVDIWVQGFEQPDSCSWEAWTSDDVLFEYDEKENELTIRGNLYS